MDNRTIYGGFNNEMIRLYVDDSQRDMIQTYIESLYYEYDRLIKQQKQKSKSEEDKYLYRIGAVDE